MGSSRGRVFAFGVWLATSLALAADSRIDPATEWLRADPQRAQTIVMPAGEVERRVAADLARDHGGVYRFGVELPTALTPFTAGDSIDLGTERAWRLRIASPGALSLHLLIDSFQPVPGSRLYVVSDSSGRVSGPYTTRDRHPSSLLGTPPLPGDSLTLVYFTPRAGGFGGFRIAEVVHGYRDIFAYAAEAGGAGGNASTCNIDINCPIAAQHQDVKRAVALLVLGGGACSGALLNNVQQDGTQLFLTAEHCFNAAPGAGGWSFVFNFEKPGCPGSGTPSQSDSVSGATLLAKGSLSDFCLVRIDAPIPPWFNVFFAGFDATGASVSNVNSIHHPCGDVKKFNKDENPIAKQVFQGMQMWFIAKWEAGINEPGSSGSPLLDPLQRVLGQLWGGAAVCGSPITDYYGRLEVSWNQGAGTHLDPVGSGSLSVAGLDGTAVISLDVAATGVTVPASAEVGETIDVAFALDSVGSYPPALVDWTAVLSADGVIDAADFVLASGTATSLGAQLESITIPFEIAPGAWNIVVRSPPSAFDADPSNNDALAAPITIQPTTKPNLSAKAVSLPAQVEKGASVIADCEIVGNAFVSGSVAYRVHLSSDDVVSETDPLLGVFSTTTLGLQQPTVKIPLSMPAGVFRVGLLVVAADGEIFLADNALLGGEVTVVAPPPPAPDVSVIAVGAPTKGKVGKKSTFSVTLGATQFGGPIVYQLRLSQDAEITADDLLLKNFTAATIGTAKKKVKIPAVTPGAWFVGVTVDSVAGELDLTDNVFPGVPITIKPKN